MKYKEHLQKVKSSAADAANTRRQHEKLEASRVEGNLDDAREWIEKAVVAELAMAKTSLEGEVLVEYELPMQVHDPRLGAVIVVDFQMRPWETLPGQKIFSRKLIVDSARQVKTAQRSIDLPELRGSIDQLDGMSFAEIILKGISEVIDSD